MTALREGSLAAMTAMTSTKRSLLALSHAMERTVLTASDEPESGGLIIALFQRREFFDHEAERHASLALGGAMCIVAFVGPATGLPAGVHGVSLKPDDSLAEEWSLVTLDSSTGSALVALPTGGLAEGEATLEAARLFEGRWTFLSGAAAIEGQRILEILAVDLDPAVVEVARSTLASKISAPDNADVVRVTEVTQRLVAQVDQAHSRAARSNAKLLRTQRLAEVDQLTGLNNRHYLERFLGTVEHGTPLTLAALLIDLDGLKRINDTHGHTAGDVAIQTAANCIRDHTREGDVLCRVGGDEFLVLLPGLSADEGLTLGSRIALAISRAQVDDPWQFLTLSASVGVAMAEPTRVPMEKLDKALYEVKRSGKGRAKLFEDRLDP
ncbi:MAG: diguanylate cyclase [Actinobacteria bacterium]|nr:diguanylate cyclase [Actinomycetota bacterium]